MGRGASHLSGVKMVAWGTWYLCNKQEEAGFLSISFGPATTPELTGGVNLPTVAGPC
jgi:hypothetical protein